MACSRLKPRLSLAALRGEHDAADYLLPVAYVEIVRVRFVHLWRARPHDRGRADRRRTGRFP